MITTIIFDFGDVLVRDTTKVLEKKYKFDRLPKAKQKAYIKAFHESEVGKIPSTELLKVIHKTLDPKESPKEIEEFITKPSLLPPWKLAQKLRKNYQVVIFSNNQKRWPSIIAKHLGMNLKPFPFLNSAYVGMRKPDLQFYRYLIKKFNFNPKEAVFIDDKEKNLKPARRLGIHTFHYQNNPKELITFLKYLKISI